MGVDCYDYDDVVHTILWVGSNWWILSSLALSGVPSTSDVSSSSASYLALTIDTGLSVSPPNCPGLF